MNAADISIQQMLAAATPTIESGKKVYRVGFNTQAAKARLEELIRAHVVREALRTKRTLGGEEGDSYYADTTARLDRGEYATLGTGWGNILRGANGGAMFLLSLLQENHPDMTVADTTALSRAEPEQVAAAVKVVAPDFFRAVLDDTDLPPERRAEIVAQIVAELTKVPAPATGST